MFLTKKFSIVSARKINSNYCDLKVICGLFFKKERKRISYMLNLSNFAVEKRAISLLQMII